MREFKHQSECLIRDKLLKNENSTVLRVKSTAYTRKINFNSHEYVANLGSK
jgi:hypothetical protein